MKNRTGFVSNSSSSSFIIGVAAVSDRAQVDALLKGAFSEYSAKVIEALPGSFDLLLNTSVVAIPDEPGMVRVIVEEEAHGTSESIEVPLGWDVLVVALENNEGDYGRFAYDEDAGEIDYNIDLDHFTEKQQAVFRAIVDSTHGLAGGQARFGARRNG